MIDLYGKRFAPHEIKDLVGDISTIIGVKPYTLFEGPERGVLAVDVWAGDFRFTVLPDRGMDVCGARYRGIPLDWSSGTGVTSPFFYDPADYEKISSPSDSGDEEIIHPCVDTGAGDVTIELYNPKLETGGLGIYYTYDPAQLPHLTLWKLFQKRTNVLAIEPGTCRVGGRKVEADAGRAVRLARDESIHTRIEIGVLAR